MANWKVWKFRELDELNIFLNGGVHGAEVSFYGNSLGGGTGGSKQVPNIVGAYLTLKNPPGTVTFTAGANPNGLIFKEIKTQIENVIAGVVVKQFEGRLYLIEASPSTGVVVAAAPAGGFATVNGTVDLNTLSFGGGGDLDALVIVLKHNSGANLTVTFAAPVNVGDVFAQINAVTSPGIVASENGDGTLHLQTNDEGAGKNIVVNAGGTALAVLGVTSGTYAAPSTNTANAALGFDTSIDTAGKVYGSPYISPPVAPYFGWSYSDGNNMHVVWTFE